MILRSRPSYPPPLRIDRELPSGFFDFAATQAPRADVHALHLRAEFHTYALEVGHPPPAAHVVCVTDPVSEYRCFAANLALLGHGFELLK